MNVFAEVCLVGILRPVQKQKLFVPTHIPEND